MADKFVQLSGGKLNLKEATTVSAGAGDAGEIPALDSTGKLDVSVLPVGVGPDVKVLETTEALNAGDYVNIFDDAGTAKIRLADNSNGRDAHGYVIATAAISDSVTVYFEGANTFLSGLTPGGRVYLGTAGDVIQTALDPSLVTGSIHQFLGIAISATEVNTDIDDCILL